MIAKNSSWEIHLLYFKLFLTRIEKSKIDYISRKENIMEILGKALYLLLIIVFMRFFYFVLRKSFEDRNATTVKMVTRGIVYLSIQ